MAARILDADAQIARTLIQIKRTGLENGLVAAPIKIAK